MKFWKTKEPESESEYKYEDERTCKKCGHIQRGRCDPRMTSLEYANLVSGINTFAVTYREGSHPDDQLGERLEAKCPVCGYVVREPCKDAT